MKRSPLLSLLIVLPSAMSCACLTAAPDALPPVAAPPPPAAATTSTERPDPATVAAVRELLASRRTALTQYEIARLAYTIVREAKRHDFDPRLVLAVMAVESGFHNFAVSQVGAMGLMQVMPATGAELAARQGIRWRGPNTLFDPIVNVRLGVAYLRELSDRYGRLHVALAAYNWGPGRIDRRLRRGSPLPEEYARLVLDAYEVQQQQEQSS